MVHSRIVVRNRKGANPECNTGANGSRLQGHTHQEEKDSAMPMFEAQGSGEKGSGFKDM